MGERDYESDFLDTGFRRSGECVIAYAIALAGMTVSVAIDLLNTEDLPPGLSKIGLRSSR